MEESCNRIYGSSTSAGTLGKTLQPNYPRHHSLAFHLADLPLDEVQESLSNMTIQTVLEVVCMRDLDTDSSLYLDECVSSHSTLGLGIPSVQGMHADAGPVIASLSQDTADEETKAQDHQDLKGVGPLNGNDLDEIKTWFKLYMRMQALNRRSPYPKIEALERTGQRFIEDRISQSLPRAALPTDSATHHSTPIVVEYIKEAIAIIFKVVYEPYISTLSHFNPFFPNQAYIQPLTIPELLNTMPTPKDTEDIFMTADTAENALTSCKISQLLRMADLLEKYPHFLRTCCEVDIQQDIRRNHNHRVEYLRLCAGRMLHGRGYNRKKLAEGPLHTEGVPARSEIAEGKHVARWIFAQRQFYLIPYDRVLRAFLKTLDRYPAKSKHNPNGHVYPRHLKLVLSGFVRVYPRYPFPDVPAEKLAPRVLYTKYSMWGCMSKGGDKQPCFFVYPEHHAVKKDEGFLPFAEKEFHWLSAFLEICEHMSKMKEIWSGEKTVEDYWRRHVLT